MTRYSILLCILAFFLLSANESNGECDGNVMCELQRELNEIILGIDIREDVAEADPKIGAIYEKMAAFIIERSDDTSLTEVLDHSEMERWDEQVTKHIEEISLNDPDVGMALAVVLMKHSALFLKAIDEIHQPDDLRKQLDEVAKALEEAKKELEKLNE